MVSATESQKQRQPPRKIAVLRQIHTRGSPTVSIVNENYKKFNTFSIPMPNSDEETPDEFHECEPFSLDLK